MKTSLQTVLNSLREANGPTRFVLGLAMITILGIAGVSWYRSANPQMEFFRGDLESAEFSRVTSALGAKGIRFDSGGDAFFVNIRYVGLGVRVRAKIVDNDDGSYLVTFKPT